MVGRLRWIEDKLDFDPTQELSIHSIRREDRPSLFIMSEFPLTVQHRRDSPMPHPVQGNALTGLELARAGRQFMAR